MLLRGKTTTIVKQEVNELKNDWGQVMGNR